MTLLLLLRPHHIGSTPVSPVLVGVFTDLTEIRTRVATLTETRTRTANLAEHNTRTADFSE